MKLSIIIPNYNYYNFEELFKTLNEQITDECEIIFVDDGSEPKPVIINCKNLITIYKQNGGVSSARNIGLDISKGENILFIDSDDMISINFIETILNKIDNSEFDYCLFSWQFNGKTKQDVIIENNPPSWNFSVWNCIYSRKAIGNERFREDLRKGEDGEFNSRVRKGKKENIKEILYFYNNGREGSLTNE